MLYPKDSKILQDRDEILRDLLSALPDVLGFAKKNMINILQKTLITNSKVKK